MKSDDWPRDILVLTGDHGRPDPAKRGGHYNEEDMVTHRAMVEAFESLERYRFRFMTDHGRFLDEMRRDPPDLVVNFCDTGFENVITRELNVPAYLELLGIPYSGATPAAMVMCYDKQVVRLVAQSLGVAVPEETMIAAGADVRRLPEIYPALIKPNRADGSLGITKDAVVRNAEEAAAYLAWLRDTLGPQDVLMQEYLPGKEYGIGLIGNVEAELRAMPALEVDYTGLPAGLNPILSYESKAIPDSPYWTDIRFVRAGLPPEEEARLAASAEKLFRRFGLRDYGRFDFRTGADGVVKLLEINPNPAWANDGKLAVMAGFADIAYRDMLAMVLDAAIARVRADHG